MDYPGTVATITSRVRFIADDQEINWLDDALQMSMINAGWEDFQLRMSNAGSGIMRKTAVLTVPANTTIINADSTTPALPDDFVFPYRLAERPVGSGNQFQDMDEKTWTWGVPPRQWLGVWTWEGNAINFIGATQPLEVKMEYARFLDALIDPKQQIPIPFSTNAIAWCVLYTVALARGAPDAYRDRCSASADKAIADLTSFHVKRDQVRRAHRPAHATWRF